MGRPNFPLKYLMRIADRVDLQIAAMMDEKGLTGLTRSHLEILSFLLRRPGLTPTEIAIQIQRTKPTVTVLVRKLVDQQYLTSTKSTTDGRSIVLRPTQKAKRMKPAILRIMLTLHRETYAAMTELEAQELYRITEKLNEAMERKASTLAGGGKGRDR